MQKNDHSYFANTACAYYPCHKTAAEEFNCLFCYCPLYALGTDCGGNFVFLENGVKDCSACTIPHEKGGYEYVLSHWEKIAALAARKKDPLA